MFESRKTILVHKPPYQFPNCWFHIPDENDYSDGSNIPTYDLELTKSAMDQTFNLCESLNVARKNINTEEDDWEEKVSKLGWSTKHHQLFNLIVKVLDYDRLSRLANVNNKRYEAIQRRISIDKSADRMRKALASVSWDIQMCQWIHGIFMDQLPSSYLASYLEIMQTLKVKLPSLVDKMIFWKPGSVNQDLLAPILKKPWQPVLNNKYRKLPGNPLLVVIPSAAPRLTPQSSRLQKLYTLFTTMAPMLPVQLNINGIAAQNQSLQSIAEQTVSITRTKIQELQAENPDRRLILIGMNSASVLAMQVALVEQVSGVVGFGFSYNTVHGVRGQADDQLLGLSTPVLFLVGQNAARSNEEEIEFFREKMSAPTSLVVVGSADDFLRVTKTKRRIEGVTQEMVDNMIVDEIAEFSTKCLQRPLKIKPKVSFNAPIRDIDSSCGQLKKKMKLTNIDENNSSKVLNKSQKNMRPTSTTGISGINEDATEMAVQSILPADHEEQIPAQTIKSSSTKFITGNRIVTSAVEKKMVLSVKPQVTKSKFIAMRGEKNPRINIQSRPISKAGSRSVTPSSQPYVLNNRGLTVGKSTQSQQQSFSPTKYTIVRSTSNIPNVSYSNDSSSNPEVSGTNIFDMPIVFADHDGNIDEDSSRMSDEVISIASDSPPHVAKQVVLKTSNVSNSASSGTSSFTITKNKNILIQKPLPKPTQTTRMFMINGTVIGRQVSPNNIVLPKSNLTQTSKIQKIIPGTKILNAQLKPSTAPVGKKIEILNNTIIKPATTTSAATTSKIQPATFVNLADTKTTTGRFSLTSSTPIKNQIIINTSTLKPYTGSQIIPTSLGNKQLGNLTVKRLNVLPSSAITKIIKKS